MAQLNETKYRNAILYFAWHIDSNSLAKVKLMKLLYFLDFRHYAQYGSSVTGDEYRRLDMGPVPIHAEAVLHTMEIDHSLVIRKRDIGYPNPKSEYLPLVEYDIRVFSPTEVEVLCFVTDGYGKESTSKLVQIAHSEAPWLETAPSATIDYRLALHSRSEDDFWETVTMVDMDIVQLTAEEEHLRARGFAQIARVEEFAKTHPEFVAALRATVDEMEAGEYDVFDQNGWHDR